MGTLYGFLKIYVYTNVMIKQTHSLVGVDLFSVITRELNALLDQGSIKEFSIEKEKSIFIFVCLRIKNT